MDFQNDLKYQQLKKIIDSTAVDLENCSRGEYLPQKRRLHTWALADMGDYLYNNDLYSDALTYYTLAKKFDCDEASVLNQMGICLMHLGKIDRALYYFEQMSRRAISLSDKALAWYNMSVCYRKTPGLNEAILALKKSLKYSYNEEHAAALEQLKEMNSTKQFLNFTQSIFRKNVLPKEETDSKHTTKSIPMA